MTIGYLVPVRLVSDRYRADGVGPGAVGVVVDNWGDGSREVEFSNQDTGETTALPTVAADEIEPVAPARATAGARRGNRGP